MKNDTQFSFDAQADLFSVDQYSFSCTKSVIDRLEKYPIAKQILSIAVLCTWETKYLSRSAGNSVNGWKVNIP